MHFKLHTSEGKERKNMNIDKTEFISTDSVPAEWSEIIDKIEIIKDAILKLSRDYKVDIEFSTCRKHGFFSIEVGDREERRIGGYHDYSKLTRNIWEDGDVTNRAYRFSQDGGDSE